MSGRPRKQSGWRGLDGWRPAWPPQGTNVSCCRNQMRCLIRRPAAPDTNGEVDGSTPTKKNRSAKDVFGMLSRARRSGGAREGPDDGRCVSDTNDLLRYRYHGGASGNISGTSGSVNVIVSNAPPISATRSPRWTLRLTRGILRIRHAGEGGNGDYQAGASFPSVSALMAGPASQSYGGQEIRLGDRVVPRSLRRGPPRFVRADLDEE